jgi:hypothetical protein
VSDFLDDRRREITDRLKELKPVVEEFHRLEAAVEALASVVGSAASEAASATTTVVTRRRGPGRPSGSSTGKKGPGRRRGSGKRARKATRASTPVANSPAATAAVAADATPAVAERKGPGRPKGSGKKVGRPPGSGKKVGRPAGKVGRPAGKVGRPKGKVGPRKGSGTRALETLSLVQAQPGITIPELAAKMGIKQNYLYRVLPGLEKEGKVEKKGRGWHAKA